MTVPPLQQIYAYLTAGCNLSCSHCWLSPKRHEDGRSALLDPDLFRTVLDEAVPLGLEGVKLTGGEPLLHPRFADFLDAVRKAGLELRIETNGLLLTEPLADRIAAVKGAAVSISIDGADKATHDSLRGREGSFEAACRAVRLMAGRGVPPQIIFTLTRGNAGDAERMIGLAEKLGAPSLKINVLQPTGRGKSLGARGEALTVAEVLKIARRLEGGDSGLELFFDVPAAFRPLRRFAPDGDSSFCGILGIIGLLPDGHYALCGIGGQIPDLVFGDAARDGLAGIWQGHPLLRELRRGLPDRLTGICGRCLMKHRCLGSCIAQNFYRTANLWAPYWFCEEAEKAGLFPGSRSITH